MSNKFNAGYMGDDMEYQVEDYELEAWEMEELEFHNFNESRSDLSQGEW